MPLSLFGHTPKCHVIDAIGKSGPFAHTFGGRAGDFGLKFLQAPRPLHLVYRIQLADPLVPVEMPGIEFLPLCYSFAYGPDCTYRVPSNEQVELIEPRRPKSYYPPWKAPADFPLSPTSFSACPYNEHQAEDALRLKGVFGWDALSRKERFRAVKLAEIHSSYTIEDAIDESWTYDDVIDCMYHPPFTQTRPNHECTNPPCEGSKCKVIAMQNAPTTSELIWPDEYVQTIWEMCDRCKQITASNQIGKSDFAL